MIEVKDLTVKYPNGNGVFDLNFHLKKGEVTGYLGPNGAGKTTTIRALMGFMKPEKGVAKINGHNCFQNAPQIQNNLGYIPGEIAFTEGMSGEEYLKFISDMRNLKNLKRQKELIDMFEFSPKGSIKKFSKGTKQKLGIVAAFMHDPDIFILDEPTSGLDPLMQNRFIELILSEKKKGKTILMSSHIFDEVERTCDEVIIIKEGRLVAKSDIHTLISTQRKGFLIKTTDQDYACNILKNEGFEVSISTENQLEIFITGESIDHFGKTIGKFTLLNLDTKKQSLEDIFMQYYAKEVK